ncbi:Uma2 family endonuclease [bacterium]|nr:MAG: Uma2 family endonuclease [bacterium]
MTAPRQQHALFTEQEYWFNEEGSTNRHEYYRGEVFAMAGATPRHNDIAGNIYASLLNQLRGKPCRARISDQRIKVEATTLQTYPDVVVVCPPFRFESGNKITLLDATVIVEVLSDSTRQYDRNNKFENYKQLPSLRHYLLVETNGVSIEHRIRLENGDWETHTFTSVDDTVNLEAIACSLSVIAIYEEVEGFE